jgi:hypothetical protein
LPAASSPPLLAVPPEEVPPADSPVLSLAAPSLLELAASSPDSLDSSLEASEEPSLEGVFAVVEVEVVCTTAFSALVSVGGVISGVLLGIASLTLLPPPHAPSPTEHSSTMLAAIAARAEGRRVVREGRTGAGGGGAGETLTTLAGVRFLV